MGWTSYNAKHYKSDGSIDRKAECDELMNSYGSRVVKSTLRGRIYYAAVETVGKYAGKDDSGQSVYKEIPKEKREVFAVVIITSTDVNNYYNFSYKDMCEDMGPAYCDCPASILKLLSPTENAFAQAWRKRCAEQAERKAASRKDEHSLKNLPVGAIIKFIALYDMKSGIKRGDEVQLIKRACRIWSRRKGYTIKNVWTDGFYRWSEKAINPCYTVLQGDA